MREWLKGKKTYMVAFGALVAIVIAWSTEGQTTEAAVKEAVALVMAMTFRGAIAK